MTSQLIRGKGESVLVPYASKAGSWRRVWTPPEQQFFLGAEDWGNATLFLG